MAVFIGAAVLLVAVAIAARWVRDRCSELDFNLFGPTTSAPTGSSS